LSTELGCEHQEIQKPRLDAERPSRVHGEETLDDILRHRVHLRLTILHHRWGVVGHGHHARAEHCVRFRASAVSADALGRQKKQKIWYKLVQLNPVEIQNILKGKRTS
jgi:hypothetical protein